MLKVKSPGTHVPSSTTVVSSPMKPNPGEPKHPLVPIHKVPKHYPLKLLTVQCSSHLIEVNIAKHNATNSSCYLNPKFQIGRSQTRCPLYSYLNIV